VHETSAARAPVRDSAVFPLQHLHGCVRGSKGHMLITKVTRWVISGKA